MPAHELSALDLLATASIDIQGRMPWSSNATFLVDLCVDGEVQAQAIYKPERGERPLWDFPPGLYRREVAAYRLWAWLGWSTVAGLPATTGDRENEHEHENELECDGDHEGGSASRGEGEPDNLRPGVDAGGVPPTIVRDEAPYGTGSLQLFVPSDFEQHYFTILEGHENLHPMLQAIGAFDLMANNTDRKGGHCLLGLDGNVWAIDNGLCFAAPFKLRTVIWDFAGQPIPHELRPAIERLAGGVPDEVAELLDDEETEALAARAARLVAKPRFPTDPSGRRYPWPMV